MTAVNRHLSWRRARACVKESGGRERDHVCRADAACWWQARFAVPVQLLAYRGFTGAEVADGIVEAAAFAHDDVFRATTANKVSAAEAMCTGARCLHACGADRGGPRAVVCIYVCVWCGGGGGTSARQGVMNGIDAVAVATGQDWRAIEVGGVCLLGRAQCSSLQRAARC
jgi:hypothetical protein